MKKLLAGFFFGLVVLFSNVALAQQKPILELFHGRECPHCHAEFKWLPQLEKAYPDVEIREYEVWHDAANRVLWEARLRELGQTPRAVPTNIIGNDVIVGFDAQGIATAFEKYYGPPAIDLLEVKEADEDDGPSWWERLKSFFKNLFSRKTHYHANFNIMLNGTVLDLSNEKYMSDKPECDMPDDTPLAEKVHLHDNIGDVVHLHDDGIYWRLFLETLGFTFANETSGNFEGQNFTFNPETAFYSNGDLDADLLDREIDADERVFIIFGNLPQQGVDEFLQNIRNNAHEFDDKEETSCQ